MKRRTGMFMFSLAAIVLMTVIIYLFWDAVLGFMAPSLPEPISATVGTGIVLVIASVVTWWGRKTGLTQALEAKPSGDPEDEPDEPEDREE